MTYSFLDVVAAIAGPGIAANIGAGAANAEEGITIAASGDKNTMTEGADGNVQHNLIASDSGQITVRLLKTSPQNALLMLAYNFQKSGSAFWGRNIITVANPQTGDITTAQKCAFKKKPDIVYSKEGPMNEWVFDSGKIDTILGAPLS